MNGAETVVIQGHAIRFGIFAASAREIREQLLRLERGLFAWKRSAGLRLVLP